MSKRSVVILILLAAATISITGLVISTAAFTPRSINNTDLEDKETPIKEFPVKNDGPLNIALVRPVFTYTAYNDSFYRFYELHADTQQGEDVTEDLELLKPKISDGKPRFDRPMTTLMSHIAEVSPSTNMTIYTDIDVHGNDESDNLLLQGNEGSMHDVVIIGHLEYVTQQEYDNFREYVVQGGTLMALDGNVFYAEVKYDGDSDTLQLVKGHDWEFDGNAARKSVSERWKEETSEWLGSNYLCGSCPITFENNPLDYSHYEEQYVTNPDAKLILDYQAKAEEPHIAAINPVIATYQMTYGKGQVIVMGIYADNVVGEEKFRQFFDGLLTEHSGKKYP